MLEIDPVEYLFDLKGGKRKNVQKPIRQLNLQKEMQKKYNFSQKTNQDEKEFTQNTTSQESIPEIITKKLKS